MQQVRRTAPAGECAAAQLLLDVLNAAKTFLVKSDDKVIAQIPIEFLRGKIKRTRLVRLHAVDDEIKVFGKRLDLWLVPRLDRILDGQVMELENVRQDIDRLFDLLRRLALEIDPHHVRFVGQQLGQLIGREALLNGFKTFSVNENFHDQCVVPAVKPDSANNNTYANLGRQPMAQQNVTLRVKGVSKRFGDFSAVEDLSFEVRAGRVFGFIGPNGAGKTTTIRMIVGITVPDEGSIELFGQKISPTLQDRIGYLPEERGLYKKMKIADQLRYFAALKGVSSADAEKKMDFWLDRMDLSEWKNKKTTDLSKGMQQKIQFISTVLHDPDLLILDEPFSGLDPINVEFMIEVISEFKTQDKTIIFSTHLMETAEKLCNDILLINKARKVIAGSLREVKESYGKNLIALRVAGGEQVLADPTIVSKVTEHADEIILHLANGTDPQLLLRRLIDSGAVVSKFERVEASLNDIFIDKVRGSGIER